MKRSALLFLVFGLALPLFAQPSFQPPARPEPGNRPGPAPAMAQPGTQTSSCPEMAELDKQDMQLNVRERKMHLQQREKHLAGMQTELDGKGIQHRSGSRFMGLHGPLPPAPHGILFRFCLLAGLLLCAVVHILLTVITLKDMRARNAIDGLWLAVVLLAGVPAAIAYGLYTRRG